MGSCVSTVDIYLRKKKKTERCESGSAQASAVQEDLNSTVSC